MLLLPPSWQLDQGPPVSLAEEYEEQYESRVTGQTFRAAGHPSPGTPPEPSPRPPPSKRLEFVLMVSPGVPLCQDPPVPNHSLGRWGRAVQPQHRVEKKGWHG